MDNIYEADAYSSDKDFHMSDVHNHDHYEIYYFLGDEMNYFLDSTPLTLHKNDIVLVNKYLYHKTIYTKGNNQYRINISFNDTFLYKFLGMEYADKCIAMFNTPIRKSDDTAVSKIINETTLKLCSSFSREDELSHNIGYHRLSELLLTFIENSDRFSTPTIDDKLSGMQKRISEIAYYINKNYTENLTLQSIADNFFLNRYYLCHSFKQVSGIGITDYINKKRASEAAFLIKNSDESIAKIAQHVGFNTQAHFIGVFKKYYAATPSDYRKRIV